MIYKIIFSIDRYYVYFNKDTRIDFIIVPNTKNKIYLSMVISDDINEEIRDFKYKILEPMNLKQRTEYIENLIPSLNNINKFNL